MTTQTEAQQCADYLDGGSQWQYTNIFAPMNYRAAAELRRLEAANAELVEALISISEESTDKGARECSADAIKKHGGAA